MVRYGRAVTVGGGGTAIALASSSAQSSSAPVYGGCLTAGHQLHDVTVSPSSGFTCPGHETAITWNAVGPKGAVGPQGATGAQGPRQEEACAGNLRGPTWRALGALRVPLEPAGSVLPELERFGAR